MKKCRAREIDAKGAEARIRVDEAVLGPGVRETGGWNYGNANSETDPARREHRLPIAPDSQLRRGTECGRDLGEQAVDRDAEGIHHGDGTHGDEGRQKRVTRSGPGRFPHERNERTDSLRLPCAGLLNCTGSPPTLEPGVVANARSALIGLRTAPIVPKSPLKSDSDTYCFRLTELQLLSANGQVDLRPLANSTSCPWQDKKDWSQQDIATAQSQTTFGGSHRAVRSPGSARKNVP